MSNKNISLFNDKGRLNIDVAERALLNQGEYIYEPATETYFFFNGRFYSPVHGIAFEKKISDLLGPYVRESDSKTLLTRFTRRIALTHPLCEQAHKNLVNLLNGVLDLSNPEEVKLLPHSSDFTFYNCVSTQYDPAAQCPEWKKFLNTITQGNRELVKLIQEMFGYCLIPGNWMQTAFILIGGGGNGKSTLLELLRALLGNDNTSSLSLGELDHRFKRALLRGKLANIADEAPTSKEICSDVFKNLVSGGTITAEEKNKPAFPLQNAAKIITAANKPPVLREQTFALYRRLTVIPFEYEIKKSERNPYMVDVLKNELPGILNWALKGLQRLRDQESFTECSKAMRAKNAFIRDGDSVLIFLEECCKMNPSAQVSTRNLYSAYRAYCIERGYSPCSDNEFGRRLTVHAKNIRKRRPSRDGDRERVYCGVNLTDEAATSYEKGQRYGGHH